MGALDSALAVCGLWFRDVACVVDGAEDVVHATDRLGELREDASGRAPHRLRDAVALVDETRAALVMLNATEELALEALASRLGRLLS
jgi:DNA polymerase-3 subunit delta'